MEEIFISSMCDGCRYEAYPCPIAYIALEYPDDIKENIEKELFNGNDCLMQKFIIDTEKEMKRKELE